MKPILLLLLLLIGSFRVPAQPVQLKKIDSVCLSVKRYLNENKYDSLYELMGGTFRNRLDRETFKDLAGSQFRPLGSIDKIVFEKFTDDVGWYKVYFPAATLDLLVGLDSMNKIDFFRLKTLRGGEEVLSSNPLQTKLDRQVDGMARRYMKQQNSVGVSIGILKDGKTYFYGYGETAKGNHRVPGPATNFEIASITKTFTATLLAIAVLEGKVRLDDPVNKYLPDSIPSLQYKGKPVTLQDLANHTAALPHMPGNFDSAVVDPVHHPAGFYSVGNLYSFLKHYHLTWEPGTRYAYSNTAFDLLAVILANIFKQSYEELVAKYICTPLGMNDTREFVRNTDSSFYAKGYDENGKYITPWNHQAALSGAGGLGSTASDLLIYAEANLGKAPPSIQKALQLTHEITLLTQEATVGLGWHYIQPGATKVLFHNGGTGGYTSYFGINLNKKMAVVILANSTEALNQDGDSLMKRLENE